MHDIKCVPFGRVSCFISYMFSRSNLCIYFKSRVDSFCGGGVLWITYAIPFQAVWLLRGIFLSYF